MLSSRAAPLLLQSEAGARVVDSLINYEAVKYFGNERHEVGGLRQQ